MINAKVTRALLSVLVLGCVPALAANPDDPQIFLSNAQHLLGGHYGVTPGDVVTCGAASHPGDAIALFAVPVMPDGTFESKLATMLLFDKSAALGFVSGKFIVPELSGSTYLLVAIAMNAQGVISSTAITIKVLEPSDLRLAATPKIEGDASLDIK